MAQAASTQGVVKEVVCDNYNAIRDDVVKPFSERKSIVGRGSNSTVPRRYHLTDEECKALLEEAKALGLSCVNPLSGRTGTYWAQVQSLIDLGVDEYHSLKAVRDRMEVIMAAIPKEVKRGDKKVASNLWIEFYERRSKAGAAKARSGDGKIEQNFEVLQRLPRVDEKGVNREHNPYGLKLAQFNMSVDIEYRVVEEGVEPIPYFCLNTKWADEASVSPKRVKPKKKKA
jgi:hypothetical protein